MQGSAHGGNISRMKPAILQLIAGLSRSLSGAGGSDQPGDSELLNRFVQERDEVAFNAILARHGRLVWGVCRSLLPNDADAEDAFQATSVALFRGAAKIRRSGSLAPWLHGTATRIAKKIRLAAARRSCREHRAAKPESAPVAVSEKNWAALHFAVHDEIARLPVILGVAFVLCVLEGRRYEDAAVQLGVPIGTLSARVSRARKMLLVRVTARGLAPAMAVAAVGCVTANAPATVPEPMLLLIRHHLADGFASVSETIVNFATSVAGGVSMKIKMLTAAILLAGTLTATSGGVWFANAQDEGKLSPGSGPARPKVVPPGPRADPKKAVEPMKVLTPDQIVQGKIEGPVRVEFVVESLYWQTGVSTEKEMPMNFKLKGVKAGNSEFDVQVAGKLFGRLHDLGIQDSPEESGKHNEVAVHRHFMGKTVRVNGVVKRIPHAKGDGVLHWLRIDSLDQIVSVSRK